MKIAIFSRPGPCFPNIISIGLAGMLDELGIESTFFYDSIPMLMRLLPLNKSPKRWHNNLSFRIRNKLANYSKDRNLIKELASYDAIIVSECYPNAFWKNYFAIEELKNEFKGPVISYTESPLDAAPLNKLRLLDADDYSEDRYDFNLFVTGAMEIKTTLKPGQAVIGANIAHSKGLQPGKKNEFTAVVDFAQPGYEAYREQQIRVLKKMHITTIALEGKYPVEEIRKIYQQASVFFLSFPETFGLPIAECLACGAYIVTPNSAWPMSWRLDEQLMPMGPGLLPDCFLVYDTETELENKLLHLKETYNPEKTPNAVFETFLKNYPSFYYGDTKALSDILNRL